MRLLLLCLCCLGLSMSAVAQSSAPKKVKVAVLLPLYLDSAFNGANYKLGNNNLPKYMLPGLEFYNGILMAVDSLQKERQPVEVMVHDTKSAQKSISMLLVEPEIADASFIIGSFTTKDELKKVADFANNRRIPLLSATYPNDGGITSNAYMAMINPTLSTHIESVYKYVQRNYALDNVILFKRKSDAMDKYIMESMMEVSKKYNNGSLRINYVEVNDAFNPQDVLAKLDSTRKNIIIGATLNETFAGNIVRTLSGVKATYESAVIGMPTWDVMPELNRADTRGIEVTYSSPYNFQRTDKFLARLAGAYKDKWNGKASDMMFKGYEAMYHFTKLYLKHDSAFIRNLSDKDHRITNDFDFQPARARKDNTSADYLENRKLYFITRMDGKVRSVR